MRAVATASWMARLMPTPPMGHMAWAASPISRTPGAVPAAQAVDHDGEHVDVVPDLRASAPSGQRGRQPGDVVHQCLQAGGPHRVVAAFGDDVGDLEVVAPVDQHEAHAGADDEGRARRGRTPPAAARNHSTSIGAPNVLGAQPRSRRTSEWRPSQATVRRARISTRPSDLGGDADTAVTATVRGAQPVDLSVERSRVNARVRRRFVGEEVEEVPLGHQGDVLVAAGQAGAVGHGVGPPPNDTGQSADLLVGRGAGTLRPSPSSSIRLSVEAWMVSPRKSRRKSACFSSTVTDRPARQQEDGQHHAGRPAADDADVSLEHLRSQSPSGEV